jgi:pimeloyl-ACP methyl ester carboxylesterase
VDRKRRSLLTTGAAAAAAAAAPRAFGQQKPADKGERIMPVYQKGSVRIQYQEAGSGFPLLVIPGGGLNSTISFLAGRAPFNPMKDFADEYRCVAADLRNAPDGQSTGPVEPDRPWDCHADDQLGLMDHLGIKRFMVLGFCIGGPFIWNLIKRAPDRVVAGVISQPVGFRKDMPDVMHEHSMKQWAPGLMQRNPAITPETAERYATRMFRTNADFVFTVSRDFVRGCRTPVLVMPDDTASHPYDVAMESALLAPKSEVTLFPWKEPKDRIPVAVRHVRSFLKAHRPAA